MTTQPAWLHDSQVSDETVLRRLYQQVLDAWNRRDAAAYTAPFAEDASVVGFDGISNLEAATHLTTVEIPLSAIGARAVELLLREIENESWLGQMVFEQEKLPVSLQIGRASCRERV